MTEPFFKDDSKPAPENEPGEKESKKKSIPESEEAFGEEMSPDNRRMASIMAYIPFLCFVPLLSMGDNKEVRFHARQGVILFIIELICVLFLIDRVSDFFFKVILIFAAGFSVAGLILAFQGKTYKLPIIGDMIEKSKLDF